MKTKGSKDSVKIKTGLEKTGQVDERKKRGLKGGVRVFRRKKPHFHEFFSEIRMK